MAPSGPKYKAYSTSNWILSDWLILTPRAPWDSPSSLRPESSNIREGRISNLPWSSNSLNQNKRNMSFHAKVVVLIKKTLMWTCRIKTSGAEETWGPSPSRYRIWTPCETKVNAIYQSTITKSKLLILKLMMKTPAKNVCKNLLLDSHYSRLKIELMLNPSEATRALWPASRRTRSRGSIRSSAISRDRSRTLT